MDNYNDYIDIGEFDEIEIDFDNAEIVIVPPLTEQVYVTPTTEQQVIKPSDDHYIDEVTVYAVNPSDYQKPEEELNVTPTTDEQTIIPQENHVFNRVNVEAISDKLDPNFQEDNIAEGVTLFGKTGTYSGGTKIKVADEYVKEVEFKSDPQTQLDNINTRLQEDASDIRDVKQQIATLGADIEQDYVPQTKESGYRVYTSENGKQTTTIYENGAVGNTIAYRDRNGTMKVSEPLSDKDCTNKKYVNDYVNERFNGASKPLGYDSYQTMIMAFNSLGNDVYKVGQDILILTTGVPDLWIYSVELESQLYNYTDDEIFVNELLARGYVQIGYYRLGYLETQKVDLSDYMDINASKPFTKTPTVQYVGEENLFDYDTQNWTDGLLNTSGGIGTNNSYKTTDYLDFMEAGESYLVTFTQNFIIDSSNGSSNRIAFYNSDKEFIGTEQEFSKQYPLGTKGTYSRTITVPENAKYFRYSVRVTDSDISIKHASLVTPVALGTDLENYVQKMTESGNRVYLSINGVQSSGVFTDSAVGSAFIRRDGQGNFKINEPTADNHPTPKKFVEDNYLAKVTDTNERQRVYSVSTSGNQQMLKVSTSADGFTLALRKENGTMTAGDPVSEYDVVNKRYLEQLITELRQELLNK